MRIIMKKYLFVSALSISLSCFASMHSNRIEGKYACAGHEVGTHDVFKCEMTIKPTGETYASTANCSDGNAYTGTGIYDKNSHQLSTVFINPKKSDETGVSVAHVKADGSIVAEWTYINKTSIAHSKCTKKN